MNMLIKKRESFDNENGYLSSVSIIIPTYNEERVIARKIENCLELDYPEDKHEIIVVDSGSTDGTREIVKKFVDRKVKLLIQEKRKGKAAAINEALKYAKGEIIIVTDANALLNKSAVRDIVKRFSNPKVGGVEGRYLLVRKGEYGLSAEESLFRRLENWIKEKESVIDSIAGMVGELFAFRRGAIDKFDEKAITEDFEASIRIRKLGYRLCHERRAIVIEHAPATLTDVINQKKRRIIGTIQTLFMHFDALFNPKLGFYGLLILPSHKLLQILTPYFLILFIISSSCFLLSVNSMLTRVVLALEALCICIGIVSLIITTRKQNVHKFVKSVGYFVLINLLTMMAWIDYLTKRYNVLWKKTESTRDLSIPINI